MPNDLQRRMYLIKKEFYETVSPRKGFWLFKREWLLFFKKNMSIYQIWALYVGKAYNYNPLFLYARARQVLKQFNFKKDLLNTYKVRLKRNTKNLYWGFLSFWKVLKFWSFSGMLFIGVFYVLLVKRAGILPQTLFFWVGVSMLLYWLLSGFVFFVKKYQFSRYTSVIQRFWRRSYILFWLIEGGLLLVFFYLMVNSSQESFYMFDQGYFLKTHLFSWKIFIFKCVLVVSLITYSYIFLLNLKWSNFNKNILPLTVITVLLLYLLWLEFYQIYWVSNFYANFTWLYDFEEAIWSLEWDARRTRILNHYVMVLFLLKFWHIVFIFAGWVFFLLRSNELDVVTYPLFSFNFQNFIILFIMMWLFMYPWFRHTFHWLAEIPYHWFYVDIHASFFKVFVYDAYTFYYNGLKYVLRPWLDYYFHVYDFINWVGFEALFDQNVFIKNTIKNTVLRQLV